MESFFDYLPSELLYIISTYLGLSYLKTYEISNLFNSSLNKAYEKYLSDVKSGFINPFKTTKLKSLKFYPYFDENSDTTGYDIIDRKINIDESNLLQLKDRLTGELDDFIDLDVIYADIYQKWYEDGKYINFNIIYVLNNKYIRYYKKKGYDIIDVTMNKSIEEDNHL